MGSQTGQMKVLNALDPCGGNTQPKALGQGLLRWSDLLRWKWGGCGKQAQERKVSSPAQRGSSDKKKSLVPGFTCRVHHFKAENQA